MLVLVGNKADTLEPAVSVEEITSFVEDKKLVYYDTSAKTGQNVKDMFIWVATELAERTPTAGGANTRVKGTTLEEVAEEKKGNSGWKNCC